MVLLVCTWSAINKICMVLILQIIIKSTTKNHSMVLDDVSVCVEKSVGMVMVVEELYLCHKPVFNF